jgi:hypothetical protein
VRFAGRRVRFAGRRARSADFRSFATRANLVEKIDLDDVIGDAENFAPPKEGAGGGWWGHETAACVRVRARELS